MSKQIKFCLIFLILLTNCTFHSKYYIKTVTSPRKYYSKIAVIPENFDTYWISSFAYRALITELMDVGFSVIERSNIESVLDERKLQVSGLTGSDREHSVLTHTLDKGSIAELGKLLGVNNLVLVYIVPTGRRIHLGAVRLVEVETGRVITSTTFVARTTGEDTDVVMKQVALDIVDALKSQKTIIHNDLFGGDPTTNNKRRIKGDQLISEKQ